MGLSYPVFMLMSIKKTDEELQILYAEVYAPNIPDSDGDFMRAVEIRKAAHKFLAKGITANVDSYHDNVLTGSRVVESFIARKGDDTFIEDSWVVGIYVPDPMLWDSIKKGEINGLSFEGAVRLEQREIDLVIPETLDGQTQPSGEVPHAHNFVVKYDDEGNFLGGKTDVVNGHSHAIVRGTVTQTFDNHAHKFAFVDILVDLLEDAPHG